MAVGDAASKEPVDVEGLGSVKERDVAEKANKAVSTAFEGIAVEA